MPEECGDMNISYSIISKELISIESQEELHGKNAHP